MQGERKEKAMVGTDILAFFKSRAVPYLGSLSEAQPAPLTPALFDAPSPSANPKPPVPAAAANIEPLFQKDCLDDCPVPVVLLCHRR
jgi:hypothetical protein